MPRFQRRSRLRSPTLSLCLVVLITSIGACAPLPTRPDEAALVDVPLSWSAAERSGASTGLLAVSSLAQWWQRFDDPVLAGLVTQALQANTTVNSAQAALRQARALRDVSAGGLLPSLGSSASAQRNSSGSNNASSNFNVGLDASWELDIFGTKRSALDASAAASQASAATLGDTQVSVAAEVALNYITLRSAQVRLRIATENLASQQETLQITRWRQQAGLVTSLEAEQSFAASEQTRAQLPALQTTVQQTRHALAVLTGQAPAALNALLADEGLIPQAPSDLALALPFDTLRQRADVRAAEFQVNAAKARVSQADAARAPGFKLGGSLGLSALTLGALTDGASVVASLLASVSFPLFDGGAGLAQVTAQQAALDQSLQTYRGTILTALKEVEDALVALRGDRERLVPLQNAAQSAANAAQLARQRYSSGLVDFSVVLETQRTQLSAQDSVASATAAISTDHVRLYKALGGGWVPDSTDTATATPTLSRITTP